MKTLPNVISVFTQGNDVSPTTGIATYHTSTDDTGICEGHTYARSQELRDPLKVFTQGNDVSPTTGIATYTASCADSGTSIGHTRSDDFGNDISDQRRKGAVS